ncbi:hypothetical protein V8E36_005404 [Tilletia maclaganii]
MLFSPLLLLAAFLACAPQARPSPLVDLLHDGQIDPRQVSGTVTVRTPKRGSFRGFKMDAIGQDQFLGIRYVQPITSSSRFQRASSLLDQDPSVVHDATSIGPLCMQGTTSDLTDAQMSEDCLTMQIIRPQGISSSKPIPVLVFFHGGGWAHGGSTFNIYNGTQLVAESVRQGKPIIYINLNYRLGIFGFLGGKEMYDSDAAGTAALNAGYWDQHQALQFIEANIASFGGDPSQITIWGQSAGASSVAAHLLADSGRSGSSLFSKAIMESGSAQLYPRYNATASRPQQQYNAVLKATSCSNLACVRRASRSTLQSVNIQVTTQDDATFSPTLDRYFHQQAPSVAVNSGTFADVPILMGTNLDDGTFVEACRGMDTVSELSSFFNSQYGSLDVVSSLLATYPDKPAEGCPFRPVLYGSSPYDRFYGITSQYKRCAAIETDLLFSVGKRAMLSAASKFNKQPAFGYLWAQRTPSNGKPAKGVTHSCELGVIFDRPNLSGQDDAASRTYASSKDIEATTDHVVTSLLTFVANGNPNAKGFPTWPAYDTSRRSLMQFEGTYNTTVIADTFRSSQISFLQGRASAFGI